ncbi:MAG TPA: phage holin family protein [Clostridia bacterium]|nr:phage holin family protein [Clostridia bacterium]
MKNALHLLSGAAMAALAFLLRALGGWDAALMLMLLMMGLDLVSGLILSFQRRSAKTPRGGFDSGAMFLGLTRKLLMLLLVILGTALDSLLGSGICRLCVIGFYSAGEALSVVENAALAGVPFPRGLLASLERYRERLDRAGSGEE